MLEAKDTIINGTIIRKCSGKSVRVDKNLKEILGIQAEFSYNTAIKIGAQKFYNELKEFVRLYGTEATFPKGWHQDLPTWNEFLEKWGIE
jgi:hypothetical protein